LSSCNGPGASNWLLPKTTAAPATIRTSTNAVNTALPTITSGLRARLEGRLGAGTWSGSRAARGLRGAMRLGSIYDPSTPSGRAGGDWRLRAHRAKPGPAGRCRGGHPGGRWCRVRRGRHEFSRCGRARQRQIPRLAYRRGIALASVFGDPFCRVIRLHRRQARYFGGKAEDAFRRPGARRVGRLSWGRAGQRRLRRQAGRDPMPRSRGLGLHRGVSTRRIAAVAPRRCALRGHRPSPTLTSAIAGTTTPNSASDRRTPENVGSRFRPAIARPRRRTAPSTLKANMAKGRNRESHTLAERTAVLTPLATTALTHFGYRF